MDKKNQKERQTLTPMELFLIKEIEALSRIKNNDESEDIPEGSENKTETNKTRWCVAPVRHLARILCIKQNALRRHLNILIEDGFIIKKTILHGYTWKTGYRVDFARYYDYLREKTNGMSAQEKSFRNRFIKISLEEFYLLSSMNPKENSKLNAKEFREASDEYYEKFFHEENNAKTPDENDLWQKILLEI